MKICVMGKGDFCLCKNRTQTFLLQRKTCPRFLSLRWNLSAVLVIAMELVRSSCHCDGVKRQKQSPYKLPTDRHTAFAMTILNLSLRAVQKARRGNLLAMTTC